MDPLPPLEGLKDEELARLCQRGEYSAFEVLFERYQRPILAYIYQITRDYEEAACIAQEVFLKLFENVESFDVERRFSTWFYTIARNASIDFLQSRRRRVMVSFTDIDRNEGDNVILSVSPARGKPVDHHLTESESTGALHQAIATLPQIYREIIELIIFQDLSYEQASQILGGVSQGTLRSRMFHALKHLRNQLSRTGGKNGENLL